MANPKLRAFDWAARCKWLLMVELKKRKVTYQDLSAKLAAIGVDESVAAVRSKLASGKFSAVFFLQCMEAIGATSIRFDYGDMVT